eukprot:PDM67681.1 hypothetical protein PRIPAC_45725 [Pristionchus pacificus]
MCEKKRPLPLQYSPHFLAAVRSTTCPPGHTMLIEAKTAHGEDRGSEMRESKNNGHNGAVAAQIDNCSGVIH